MAYSANTGTQKYYNPTTGLWESRPADVVFNSTGSGYNSDSGTQKYFSPIYGLYESRPLQFIFATSAAAVTYTQNNSVKANITGGVSNSVRACIQNTPLTNITVEQQQNGNSWASIRHDLVGGFIYHGLYQGFTPSKHAIELAAVKTLLRWADSNEKQYNIRCELYSGSNPISGTLIATSYNRVNSLTVSHSFSEHYFYFPKGIVIPQSTLYSFYIITDSVPDGVATYTDDLESFFQSGNPYSGGQMGQRRSDTGGSSWSTTSSSSNDAYFAIYEYSTFTDNSVKANIGPQRLTQASSAKANIKVTTPQDNSVKAWIQGNVDKPFDAYRGTTQNYSFSLTDANRKVAFRFIPWTNITADKIFTYVTTATSSPAYSVGIMADSSDSPSGTYLTSSTINPTSAGFYQANVSPVDLVAGTTYWLVIQYSSGTIGFSNAATFGLGQDSTDGRWLQNMEPGGLSCYLSTNGSTYFQQSTVMGLFSLNGVMGQSFNAINDSRVYGVRYRGQSYKPKTTRRVSYIGFWVSKSGTPGADLSYEIRDQANTLLDSGTLATEASISGSFELKTAALGSMLTFTAGNSYRVSVFSSGGNASNYYNVYGLNLGNNPAGFSLVESTYGGSQSAYTSSDNSGSSWTDNVLADTSFTFDAMISQGVKANIALNSFSNDNSVKADVRVNNNTQNNSVKADVKRVNDTQNNSAKANVRVNNNVQANNVKSNIRVNNNTQNNSVKADILRTNEVASQSVKANIRVNDNTQNNSSLADILAIVSQDAFVKASIRVTNTYSNNVKADVRRTENQGNEITGNIKSTLSQGSSVKAAIRTANTVTANNSVKSNIRVNNNIQENSVKANIVAGTLQGNSTLANIKTTYYAGMSYDHKPSYDQGQNRGWQNS